jgi:hypothetical protein
MIGTSFVGVAPATFVPAGLDGLATDLTHVPCRQFHAC